MKKLTSRYVNISNPSTSTPTRYMATRAIIVDGLVHVIPQTLLLNYKKAS